MPVSETMGTQIGWFVTRAGDKLYKRARTSDEESHPSLPYPTRYKMYLALHPPLNQVPNVFHPSAVDAQVAMANPRGRPEVDGLRLIVEQKLDVVDESEQQAREFVVQVIFVLFDKLRARQRQDGCLERLCRFCLALLIMKWLNPVFRVLGLRRNAIGTRWARRQSHGHVTRNKPSRRFPQENCTDHLPILSF